MKTTVELPDQLLVAAKQRAAELRIPLRALIENGLRTSLNMIAVDTNLLVYAHLGGAPEHKSAVHSLGKAFSNRNGWGVAFPCLAEFWSIVTHPKCAGRASRPMEAAGFILEIIMHGKGQIWLPGKN